MTTVEDIKVIKLLTDVFMMELLPKKIVLIQSTNKGDPARNRGTGYRFLSRYYNHPLQKVISEYRLAFRNLAKGNKDLTICEDMDNIIDTVQQNCTAAGFHFTKAEIRDHGILINRVKQKIKDKKTNYPNTEWGNKEAPFWKQNYGI